MPEEAGRLPKLGSCVVIDFSKSIADALDRRSIGGRGHSGGDAKLPGEIRKRAIRKEIGQLRHGHGTVPDNILCPLDLHFVKVVDHTAVELFVEQRLKGGSGNGKGIADIGNMEMLTNMIFHVF